MVVPRTVETPLRLTDALRTRQFADLDSDSRRSGHRGSYVGDSSRSERLRRRHKDDCEGKSRTGRERAKTLFGIVAEAAGTLATRRWLGYRKSGIRPGNKPQAFRHRRRWGVQRECSRSGAG